MRRDDVSQLISDLYWVDRHAQENPWAARKSVIRYILAQLALLPGWNGEPLIYSVRNFPSLVCVLTRSGKRVHYRFAAVQSGWNEPIPQLTEPSFQVVVT